MVGDLTPSSAITQEYAKADPIYVEKTVVSTTIPSMTFCTSFPFGSPSSPPPCSSSLSHKRIKCWGGRDGPPSHRPWRKLLPELR